MAGLTGKTIASSYKALLRVEDDANGMGTTLSRVTDGLGTDSALSLCDDIVRVIPINDDTTWVFTVRDKDGNYLLRVDSTNDVVKANVLAMDSDINHRFLNVGSGLPTSVLDLANLIIEVSGLPLEPIHGPELSGDVKATQSDIKLIRKLLNWEPKMKLDDWLAKIISNNDFQDI